ncbi:MAG: ATP-dependent DNA helicase [Thermodesulfovibrionales bacterium]
MISGLEQESENFLVHAVAAALDGYELREPQLKMMDACARIIESGGTLIAEAGTGTGKTFAYLVPIILSGQKAVISTRTITLQEQLVSKDLKLLSALKDFDYAIAKGRGNYVCLRRINAFHPDNEEESAEHKRLLDWSASTSSGDREDCSGQGRPMIWERVCADADACHGKKCAYAKDCHYFAARRKWESAQVVVTNHALLAINAMMPVDKKILPGAGVLVIDEGHSLDSIVSEQIGLNLSDRGLERILTTLLRVDQRGIYKGLLSKTPVLFPDLEAVKVEAAVFFSRAREIPETRKVIKGTFELGGPLSVLSASIRALLEKIRTSVTGLFSEDEELDLKAAVAKLVSLCEGMEIFAEETAGFVRWAETEAKRTALRMSPIYPSDFVRDNLLPDYGPVILTSATLSVAGDFGLIKNILGLDGPETLAVPSPFDMGRQVRIAVERGIDLQQGRGIEKLAAVIVRESSKEEGGTLVLFTSRDVMRKTWEISAGKLLAGGLNPMVQGAAPNKKMLQEMRESTNSVIFGLDSFWEGVDVKGDSLNCLIITKLPFEVPSEPIVAARTGEIKKAGGNPFRDYSLPRAILKFKQGFGRLIRSKDDRGRVVICDERIETREYGRGFFESVR